MMEMGPVTIIHGNCLTALSKLPDNSVDSIVCDPPYGLKFMGKKWDYSVPTIAEWMAALRVLKPGGYVLSFAGSRTYHRMACNIEDAGFEIRDQIMWVYGSGFPKSLNIGKELEEWDGWGTALKPAHEPIVVARKPLGEATVAANARKWGTGGLNIDGCRVPTTDIIAETTNQNIRSNAYKSDNSDRERDTVYIPSDLGRFPANIIHDGSDDVLAAFPDAPGQQGDLSKHANCRQSPNGIFGGMRPALDHPARKDESTSAARFFYCAKASKSDRGEGNDHPTVKPQSLMRYLCRLVTPPGGTVLDHYSGSGSTAIAAMAEGFKAIIIEEDQHNIDIACTRVFKAVTEDISNV